MGGCAEGAGEEEGGGEGRGEGRGEGEGAESEHGGGCSGVGYGVWVFD